MDINAKLDQIAEAFASERARTLQSLGDKATPELTAKLDSIPTHLEDVRKYVKESDARVADLRARVADMNKKSDARARRIVETNRKAQAAWAQAATAPLMPETEIQKTVAWLHLLAHPEKSAGAGHPFVDEGAVAQMDSKAWQNGDA